MSFEEIIMDELDRREEVYIDNLNNGYWRKRDGSYIHISKMTTPHLLNIDKLLTRAGDPYKFRDKIRQEIDSREVTYP